MSNPIPAEALHQHTIVLGKTGSGKSSVLRLLVERQLAQQQPVCIVDPKGDWWGIKSSADGKSAGFPLVIFGGDHADVPIDARAGAQVAELYATGNRPCLIDLGGWMPGDRTRFFIDFASTLFRQTRGPRWLVIDEVHNFAPQGKVMDPDAGKMLHWANRIITEGRGKGVTVLSASQRPQKVHKDFVTSNETLIAMRVIHALDRDAMKAWIDGCGDPEKGREVMASLANMKRGEGWVWSPEIGFGPKRVVFPMFATYDSFAPQTTEADRHPKGWAEVDLEEVKAKLATAIEQADQDDPRKLRARIKELEAQLDKPRGGDLMAVADAHRKGKIEGREEADGDHRAHFERVREGIAELLSLLYVKPSESRRVTLPETSTPLDAPKPASDAPKPRPHATNGSKDETLSRAERRILTALAQYPKGREKRQIAILTGYAVNGGGFNNAISALRSAGRLVGAPQCLVITPEGIAALGDFTPLPRGRALLDHWLGELGKAERKVLESLTAAYPRKLSKVQVANAAGYEANGGGFNNAVSRLRTLELISGRAELAASRELFE